MNGSPPLLSMDPSEGLAFSETYHCLEIIVLQVVINYLSHEATAAGMNAPRYSRLSLEQLWMSCACHNSPNLHQITPARCPAAMSRKRNTG